MKKLTGMRGLRGMLSFTLQACIFSCLPIMGLPPAASALDMLKPPIGVAPAQVLPIDPRLSSTGVKVVTSDLAVSMFANIPTSAAPGSVLALTATTRNLGTVATQAPCVTKCYLSADLAVGNDIYLGQLIVVSGLAPGAGAPGRGILTVPVDTPPGAYYVLACADAGGELSELNEGNNCLTSSTKILIGKPDLQVTSVTSSRSRVGAGSTFQINDAVRNAGVSSTQAQTSTKYYLSVDQAFGNDYSIGERTVVSGLAAGAVNTGSQNVIVPTQVPDGSYYLIACADSGAALAESDENNNVFVGPLVKIAALDLIEQSVTFSPTETKAGYKINVTDTTAAPGASLPTQRTSWTAIVLSTDKIKNSGDWNIGYREVPSGSKSHTMYYSFTIPATTPPGTYYILGCADTANDIQEDNEDNNCTCAPSTLTVTGSLPDLVVDSFPLLPASADRGGAIMINASTRNSGGTPGTQKTFTQFILSPDQILWNAGDHSLGSREVPPLAAGAASSGAFTTTILTGVPQGSYYVFACADSTKAEAEANETNNCLCSDKTVTINPGLPDFVVEFPASTNLPLPASADCGSAIRVEFLTRNIGVARQNYTDSITRLSLSADKAVGNDYVLGDHKVLTEYVIEGARDVGSPTLVIPAQVPPGFYYLRACADETKVVTESNEGNNCTYTGTRIEIRPGKPDLKVSSYWSLPASVARGTSITEQVTTANLGLSPTTRETVTKCSLSSDNAVGSDYYLGEVKVPAGLASGANSIAKATLMVPAQIPAGTYYMLFTADGSNVETEANEGNNTTFTGGTVTVR